MKWLFPLVLALCCSAQQTVNPDAALLQDFDTHVRDYMKLHKSAGSKVPSKSTDSWAALTARRATFAAAIREGRAHAVQGEIFTPPIAAEFQRLIGLAMQGNHARIEQSMKRAEPVHLKLRVNDSYPEKVPLQSTPPTLLLSLPKLPTGLEYRIIGRDLVLRDSVANLIIDFAPNVLP